MTSTTIGVLERSSLDPTYPERTFQLNTQTTRSTLHSKDVWTEGANGRGGTTQRKRKPTLNFKDTHVPTFRSKKGHTRGRFFTTSVARYVPLLSRTAAVQSTFRPRRVSQPPWPRDTIVIHHRLHRCTNRTTPVAKSPTVDQIWPTVGMGLRETLLKAQATSQTAGQTRHTGTCPACLRPETQRQTPHTS